MSTPETTGVFIVQREIPEIGARAGDRIVIGEAEQWPVALARKLSREDARWAFDSSACVLEFSVPPMMPGLALRLLKEATGHELGSYLTLMED